MGASESISDQTHEGNHDLDRVNNTVAMLQAGGIAVYPLVALAIVAVVIAIEKCFVLSVRTHLPSHIIGMIETYDFAWDDLAKQFDKLDGRNYLVRFLRIILDNRAHQAWWVESRAADEASLIEKSLARWLWVLETIVTAAPLLGLLGTITGMIRAFKPFGDQGLVDPAGVTGGVAEALIATALGLFVALLALFAFNFFSHRQSRVMNEMERLGTRLIDHIRLDAAVATAPA
jgi:biopolymer transport protein ExbB